MKEQEKIELFMLHLDEETSVLELFRALSRHGVNETSAQIQQWIIEKAMDMASEGRLGFYIDEFGASDVVECDIEEANGLFAQDDVWSLASETMLHIYPIG